MSNPGAVSLVLVAVLFYALLARRIERTVLTLPMLFAGFGVLLAESGVQLLPQIGEAGILRTLAELTLVLVLFSDSSHVRLPALRREVALPARMLVVGMPLTILVGTVLVHWALPDLGWIAALLLAAILTPTDAALAQSVVRNHKVPANLRRAIEVESGLNDGLAVPVVIVATLLAVQSSGASAVGLPENVTLYSLKQVILGPLVGVATGWVLARGLDAAIDRRMTTEVFEGITFVAAAILTYSLAHLIGGNGLIAAFVGGLVFGNTLNHGTAFIRKLMQAEGQSLSMFTFLVFGAVLVPRGLAHADWSTVVVAAGFLTIVRMGPVILSLAGTGLAMREKVFLGWFGPRGLASILFGLLVFENYDVPGSDELLSCIVLTVSASIVLHGLSAKPLIGWLKRLTRQE